MDNALTMGHSKHRVKMFDHRFRVVIESDSGGKDFLLLGTDDLREANAAFEIAAANNQDRVILVLDGARIMRKRVP